MKISLQQRNRELFCRTVALTKAAIDKLEVDGETVTLTNVAAATLDIDAEGRGISATTIVRNPDALAIFRQHSPAYRRKLARKTGQVHPQPSPTMADKYQNYDRLDLIRMIEVLQVDNIRLEAQISALQIERDTAYRLRDEALQQNARQLAKLTELM